MSDDASGEPSTGGDAADGSGAADDLLAAAEGLGGEVARVRRRPGRARRRGRVLAEDGVVADDEPVAAVRSTAEEGVAPGPANSSGDRVEAMDAGIDGDAGAVRGEDEPALLDASGAVIDASAGADPASGPAEAGRTVDPGVFLADAVRGYLDSLDAHGADHPVTADRLARLRRTWALWDGGAS